MTEYDLVRIVVAHLEQERVSYVIVGAIAYNLYGIPRSTKDADIVVSVPPDGLNRILGGLPSVFVVDPQSRMELFTATTRWVVGVVDFELTIEFFLLGNDAHHQEEFGRRKRVTLPVIEIQAWIATAEDLVIQKLRWARGKDLDDVRNILAVQTDALDFAYLQSWCNRHGTQARLEEIRRSIPEI